MNRIRKVGDKYQVLVTPYNPIDPDMELLIGNWDDAAFRGFHVDEYDNMSEALYHALAMSDIDWFQLVEMHKDFYQLIGKKVKAILDSYKYTFNIETNLSNPKTLKNIMFERVLKYGERFNLTDNMNDIIRIKITNPWYNNLVHMKNNLIHIKDLRIRKVIQKNNVISLIGLTPIGTCYEIKLIPTMMDYLFQWQSENHSNDFSHLYNDFLQLQNKIDNSKRFR